MNTEKKKLDRVLHLNLEITDDWLYVTSIDNETGETYTLDFEHKGADFSPRTPHDIMLRIGMEVWSWIEILRDNFESMDEDGE